MPYLYKLVFIREDIDNPTRYLGNNTIRERRKRRIEKELVPKRD
jgi:hypothetical protein